MSFSPRFAVNSVLVLSASGTLETSAYQFFTNNTLQSCVRNMTLVSLFIKKIT